MVTPPPFVNRAVQFHDQFPRLADEVREIAIDRDLSHEFEAAEVAIADKRPEDFLRQRLVLAQATGVGGLVHAEA